MGPCKTPSTHCTACRIRLLVRLGATPYVLNKSWFPGPFLDETFETFEALEVPRVEGGGRSGGSAEGEKAFKGFEGEDEGFEAPFEAFEAFEGEDEGVP